MLFWRGLRWSVCWLILITLGCEYVGRRWTISCHVMAMPQTSTYHLNAVSLICKRFLSYIHDSDRTKQTMELHLSSILQRMCKNITVLCKTPLLATYYASNWRVWFHFEKKKCCNKKLCKGDRPVSELFQKSCVSWHMLNCWTASHNIMRELCCQWLLQHWISMRIRITEAPADVAVPYFRLGKPLSGTN